MKAETLRKSILQLAIQGKLVSQDANDEPACVLIDRIRAEKKKLVAEKKIKKDKVDSLIYKGDDNSYYEKTGKVVNNIDDEIPFEIPDSWAWCRLGNIGTWGAGSTPLRHKNEYYGGNILWLKTGDLNNSYVYDTSEKITDLALEKCSLKLNKVGDILIAMYGATIGKLAIVGAEMTTNQACCACNPLSNMNNIFLFYLLKSNKDNLINLGEGGAQPNISKEKLVNFMVAIPPIAEQERIVKQIELLEPLIAEYEKCEQKASKLDKEIKDKLKKSILQYAIQGNLVAQDASDEAASILVDSIRTEKDKLIKEKKIKKDKIDSRIYKGDDNCYYEKIGKDIKIIQEDLPFAIPNSWAWERIKNILDVRDGTHDSPKYVKLGYPLVTSKNLCNGKIDINKISYISEEDYMIYNNRSYVDNNDILFAMIGSIGNPVLITKTYDFAIKNVALFKFHSIPINNYYVLELLKYEQNNMKQESAGGVQKFVSLNYLRNYLIPIPPLAEQKRIVSKIDELFAIVDSISDVSIIK